MAISSIVSKSSAVLDTVCASSTPLSFTRVMTLTGLPKSSTHRILSVLLEEQLVAFDKDRQTYQPGARLIGWATAALSPNDLPELSTAVMEDLHRNTGGHVALSIAEGSSVLYLKTVDGGEPFRLAPRVGERSPMHACAAGKALLAHLRPYKRDAILVDADLARFTDFTITCPEAFAKNLEQVRVNGFAICDREEFLRVAGISAPIFGHHGDVVGALSLWNTIDRQDIDALLGFSTTLTTATNLISARLGYDPKPAARP